jgi:hypothetical protein
MKILEMFECDDVNDKRISFGRVWTAVCLLETFILGMMSLWWYQTGFGWHYFIPVAIMGAIGVLPYLITKWTTVKEIIAAVKEK